MGPELGLALLLYIIEESRLSCKSESVCLLASALIFRNTKSNVLKSEYWSVGFLSCKIQGGGMEAQNFQGRENYIMKT